MKQSRYPASDENGENGIIQYIDSSSFNILIPHQTNDPERRSTGMTEQAIKAATSLHPKGTNFNS